MNKSLSAVKDGVFKMTDGFLSMLGKSRNTTKKAAKNANNSAYKNGYNAPITRQHAVKRENSNQNGGGSGGRKRRSVAAAAAASKRRKTKAKGGASKKSKKSARSKKLSKALKTLAGLSHYYDGQHTRRSRRS